MIYKINNIENDEIIALIFNEIEGNLKNLNDVEVDTIKASNKTKGIEVISIIVSVKQEIDIILPLISSGAMNVTLGLISAAIYDIIKGSIMKYRRIEDYSEDKVVEIEITDSNNENIKIKVSLKDILNRDNNK